MKKRNERKGGNDFSFSYQSEFVFCHKPLNHEDSGTWDGRAIEQAHAHKPRACFTVLLFVFSLVVLYLWLVSNSCYFYSFFIFTILIFLQSWIWYSFCQSFCSVFSFSISRDTCISICLGHYQTFSTKSNKITERALCRLWPLLWSRCHFRLQNDIFLSSFSWLSKNACDLIRLKESQKKNGTIPKSLFTKPDKEARLVVQLWECLLLGRLWHRWIY